MICFINKYIINFCCTCRNGAQVLNGTSVLSSAATVILPVTKLNASE